MHTLFALLVLLWSAVVCAASAGLDDFGALLQIGSMGETSNVRTNTTSADKCGHMGTCYDKEQGWTVDCEKKEGKGACSHGSCGLFGNSRCCSPKEFCDTNAAVTEVSGGASSRFAKNTSMLGSGCVPITEPCENEGSGAECCGPMMICIKLAWFNFVPKCCDKNPTEGEGHCE